MHHITKLLPALLMSGLSVTVAATPPMLKPLPQSGFNAITLFTVGESIGDYRPPGVLDGTAAYPGEDGSLRIIINHELAPVAGYPYQLANDTTLTGSRISYMDLDTAAKTITAAGPAFDTVIDRNGTTVKDAQQISELLVEDNRGLNALCSAQGYLAGEFGFVDDLFFTHEEVSAREDHPHGGSVWVLDVNARTLQAAPELGRGAWENSAAVATPDMNEPDGHVAILLGDDIEFGDAPLYLWIGRKQPGGNLLERNGLSNGRLFAWVPDNGAETPADWRGTGNKLAGRFVPLAARNEKRRGQPGYDPAGYLDDLTLRKRTRELGAFRFSRPEDLHTDPANQQRVAFASTGQGDVFPDDDWGALYIIDMDFRLDDQKKLAADATLTIIYDGDDEDKGDFGIRNPDNLVWAGDGFVYVQEDKASKLNEFGGKSGMEASVWRIDPDEPDNYERIAMIDRSVIQPPNAEDLNPDKLGRWESSGILDVTDYFPNAPGRVFIATVQAHSLRGGDIGGREDLVQGGQLLLLEEKLLPAK